MFSRSVMSDSLQPHRLQHARLRCPPLSPGVCSDSCPLSWWCYLSISSSAALLSFGLPSSIVAQLVKNPTAMWETWVLSLCWKDPLEKGRATHSSILAWRVIGVTKSDTTERLSLHFTSSIMSSHIKMYLYKSYLYKQDYTIDVFQNAFSFFHSRLCLFVYVPRVRLFSYPEAIGHLFLPWQNLCFNPGIHPSLGGNLFPGRQTLSSVSRVEDNWT